MVSFLSPGPTQQWHVVIANGMDNAGSPNVDSVLYRWNDTALEPVQQTLPTIGASSLEVYTLDGSLFLAAASATDTR